MDVVEEEEIETDYFECCVYQSLQAIRNIDLPDMNNQKLVVILDLMNILIASSDVIGKIVDDIQEYLVDPMDDRAIKSFLDIIAHSSSNSVPTDLTNRELYIFTNTKNTLDFYEKFHQFFIKYYYSHLYSFHENSLECSSTSRIIQSTYGGSLVNKDMLRDNNTSISSVFNQVSENSAIKTSSKFRSNAKSKSKNETNESENENILGKLEKEPLVHEFEYYNLRYDNLEFDNHDKPAINIWLELQDFFIYNSSLNIAIISHSLVTENLEIDDDDNDDDDNHSKDDINMKEFNEFCDIIMKRFEYYTVSVFSDQNIRKHGKRLKDSIDYTEILNEEINKRKKKKGITIINREEDDEENRKSEELRRMLNLSEKKDEMLLDVVDIIEEKETIGSVDKKKTTSSLVSQTRKTSSINTHGEKIKTPNKILPDMLGSIYHDEFIDSNSLEPQNNRNISGHKRPRFYNYRNMHTVEEHSNDDYFNEDDIFLKLKDSKKKKNVILPIVLLDIVNDFLRFFEFEILVKHESIGYFMNKYVLPLQKVISKFISDSKIEEDHQYLFMFTSLSIYYNIYQMKDPESMLDTILEDNKDKMDLYIRDVKNRTRILIPSIDSDFHQRYVHTPSSFCINNSSSNQCYNSRYIIEKKYPIEYIYTLNEAFYEMVNRKYDAKWNHKTTWYKMNVLQTTMGPDYDHVHPWRNSLILPIDFNISKEFLDVQTEVSKMTTTDQRNDLIDKIEFIVKKSKVNHPLFSMINNDFVALDECFSSWKFLEINPNYLFTLEELYWAYESKMQDEERTSNGKYKRMAFEEFHSKFRSLCNLTETPSLYDEYYSQLFYPSLFEQCMATASFSGSVPLELEIIMMRLSMFPLSKRLYCYYESSDIRADFRRKTLEMLTSSHVNLFRTLQFFHTDVCDWVEDNMTYTFVRSDQDLLTKVPLTSIIPMILVSTQYRFMTKIQYSHWIYRYLVPFDSWCKYGAEVVEHSFIEPLIIQVSAYSYHVLYLGIMFDDSMETVGLNGKKQRTGRDKKNQETKDKYNIDYIKNILRESNGEEMTEEDKTKILSTKMKMRDDILSVLWMWMLFIPNDIKKLKIEQVPWIEEWKHTNKDISVHRILTDEVSNVQTLLKPFFPSKNKIMKEITEKIFTEHQKVQLNEDLINRINERTMKDLEKMTLQ